MALVNAVTEVHLQVGTLESNCRCCQAHTVPAKGKMSFGKHSLRLWVVGN